MQKNGFENILKIGPGNKIYFPLYVIYYISEQCEVRVCHLQQHEETFTVFFSMDLIIIVSPSSFLVRSLLNYF